MTMKKESLYKKTDNSKGAHIFKKMLEDKRLISETLRNGGKLSDLKDRINFAKPISFD